MESSSEIWYASSGKCSWYHFETSQWGKVYWVVSFDYEYKKFNFSAIF